MKIYVWQDNITDAYHNDGTLVVLANSLEEAIKLALENNKDYASVNDNIKTEKPEIYDLDKAQVIAFNYGGDD